MNSRLIGIFLFVLLLAAFYLLLYSPFGINVSFSIGFVVLILLRLTTPRFMNWTARERCLWCQKRLSDVIDLHVILKDKDKRFRVCSKNCRDRIRTFSSFLRKYQKTMLFGVSLPLLYYLTSLTLRVAGKPLAPLVTDQIIVRTLIALTLVFLAFLYLTFKGSEDTPSFSFSIHNLTLLGIKPTLITVVLVGLVWIYQGIEYLTDTLTR